MINGIGHTALTTYLSYVRLAYPSFRQPLNEALSVRGLSLIKKQQLTNLRDLCEFFIPVVSHILSLLFECLYDCIGVVNAVHIFIPFSFILKTFISIKNACRCKITMFC